MQNTIVKVDMIVSYFYVAVLTVNSLLCVDYNPVLVLKKSFVDT